VWGFGEFKDGLLRDQAVYEIRFLLIFGKELQLGSDCGRSRGLQCISPREGC